MQYDTVFGFDNTLTLSPQKSLLFVISQILFWLLHLIRFIQHNGDGHLKGGRNCKPLLIVGVAKAVDKRANKTAENFILLNKMKKLKVGNGQEVRVLKSL